MKNIRNIAALILISIALTIGVCGFVFKQVTKNDVVGYTQCGVFTSNVYYHDEIGIVLNVHDYITPPPCFSQLKTAKPIYGHKDASRNFSIAAFVPLFLALCIFAIPSRKVQSTKKKSQQKRK